MTNTEQLKCEIDYLHRENRELQLKIDRLKDLLFVAVQHVESTDDSDDGMDRWLAEAREASI